MSSVSLASAPLSPPTLPAARALGADPADLALDFDRTERTALTTAVLALCCAGASLPPEARAAAAWDLPLGARIARLLRILELTTESDALTIALSCPQAGCRRPFEINLAFASLSAAAGDSGTSGKIVPFPSGNAASVTLRLPTGRDQAAWRRQPYENQADALDAIVRSLAVEPATVPRLAPGQLEPLAAAMQAADPLVAFAVHTTCPHCGCSADLDVDLEAGALRQLGQLRRAALRDVHELATHYGWTEAEVLAVPPRRRAEYQRLIAASEKAFP